MNWCLILYWNLYKSGTDKTNVSIKRKAQGASLHCHLAQIIVILGLPKIVKMFLGDLKWKFYKVEDNISFYYLKYL